MPDISSLCSDLEAEHSALDAVVASLDDTTWDTPTPAPPWSIRDQISHLTFFDETAALAVSDPDGFLASLGEAAADIDAYMNAPLTKGRGMSGAEVLEWWRSSRAATLEAFSTLDPSLRVPWYGPPMSPASFISARLMETWAHGQDVVDALGVTRQPTDRLKHIAFLGVRARPYSYIVNSRAEPDGDVRVELTSPTGESWSWGESDSDLVEGSALDFCLLVTQRRHIDDTDLVVSGPLASEWIGIAQCFAGQPGGGRSAGQFPKVTAG